MKKPLISIIIPIYNTEKYLKECLDSVVNQTYGNKEVILIDDGSNDDSPKICDEYKESNSFIKVKHTTNNGQSEARNIGLSLASGEYVTFVDSDDKYCGNYCLERMVEISDEADLVVFDYKKMSECTTDTTSTKNEISSYFYGADYLSKEFSKNKTYYWFPFKYLIRKKLFLDNDVRFPKGRIYEDCATMYKVILKANKVISTKEPMYLYRDIREGASTACITYKTVDDAFWVSKTATDEILKNMEIDNEIKSLLLNDISYNYVNCINCVASLNKEYQKDIYKKLEDNKYILSYVKYGKQVIIKYLVNIIGIRNTSKLLSVRRMIKK